MDTCRRILLSNELKNLKKDVLRICEQITHFKFGYEHNSYSNENYFSRTEAYEQLGDLEMRIEKALKRQAEDIAADVTELERQIKVIQSRSPDVSNASSDKLELRRFENYIMDKVDASLRDINLQVNQSKVERNPIPQFSVEPSNPCIFDAPKISYSNHHSVRKNKEKCQSITNDRGICAESEIRTCQPQITPKSIKEKSNFSKDLSTECREFDNSIQKINETFIKNKETYEFIEALSNTSPFADHRPFCNLKKRIAKHKPKDDLDLTGCFKRRRSKKVDRKSIRKSSQKKNIKSSHSEKRHKKRPRTNSIHHYTKRSHSDKSRENEINKSVRLIKDLTK